KDKSYIPNISALWRKDTNLFRFVSSYLKTLRSTRELNSDDEEHVSDAIARLYNLLSFPFTALELSVNIDEEQVSEVFVRINSQGKPLNQADFILTLMSVFWDDGRKQLETFCRQARIPAKHGPSPFNYFIQPDPDQLLRVSVGVAFKRARLKYVYSILRGKDLETEQFSDERREQQFDVMKDAQARVLKLQNWHDFMKVMMQAGYRSNRMISSQNNVIFAYILYLMGRTEYSVDEFTLRTVLARWFFMSSITYRYTSSPESMMEFDLARFRNITSAEGYVDALERVCDETLTGDYWEIRLPSELATSSPRSPSLFAYHAALNLLGAKALFSKHSVSELLDPTMQAHRSALERHHLFPKGYLSKQGIVDTRDTNQIANYALVEWDDNTQISDQAPAEYLPDYIARFSRDELEQMYYWHALPENWENMKYQDFLAKRRVLIARVISDAYELLKKDVETKRLTDEPSSIPELLQIGEGISVEFKSTLRINLHTGEKDPRMELAILRTIAGFLNGNGGTLVIGVADDGYPIGIEADKFPNEDKFHLHLDNLINVRIGPQFAMYIHPHFEEYQGKRVMAVECWPSKTPVYVKDGRTERFYVRTGASTSELMPSQMTEYIKQRFDL
ncbi:MAG: RNA-binding domain-containing protein, partial [Bacteroidota bacterium]